MYLQRNLEEAIETFVPGQSDIKQVGPVSKKFGSLFSGLLTQPHFRITTSPIPGSPPASFPDHHQPHFQVTTSPISRSPPASFPDHYQPHSQVTISLIPRSPPASFPGLCHSFLVLLLCENFSLTCTHSTPAGGDSSTVQSLCGSATH